MRVRPFLKWVFFPVSFRRITFCFPEVDWSAFIIPGENIQILDLNWVYLKFFGGVVFDGNLMKRGLGPRLVSLDTDLIFINNSFFLKLYLWEATLTPIPKSIAILELLPKFWSLNLILRNWLLRPEISQGDSTCKDFPQRGNACMIKKANKKGGMKWDGGFSPVEETKARTL